MENDLISREVLKKKFDDYIKANPNLSGIFELGKIIIDTAPTVATNLQQTQGEWGKWIIAEIQCPNCFEYFETYCYSTEELNKCPNCGAKMKGGAE